MSASPSAPRRCRPPGRALPALALLVALGGPGLSAGQDLMIPAHRDPAVHIGGLWLGMYTKYQLTDSLFYYGEYHYRRRGDVLIDEMAQIYLRFGLTWRLHPQLELTSGVVTPIYWAPERRLGEDIDPVVPQFRFWQQALFGQKIGRVRFYHQLRTEQRWAREYAKGSPFDLTWRWRYKLAAYIPLNAPSLDPGTLFLSLYEEIFIQTGETIVFNHFEDNRVYAGLGYVLSPTWQVQAGYMWTYRHDNHPFRYEHRHIPRVSLYHNTDFDSLLDWFK